MSIVRVEKSGNFSVIFNAPLRDKRMSFEARGLLAFLLTKFDDWEVNTENLQNESPNAGRDKVLRMLRELADLGHLHRHKARLKDGTWDWETVVYECPSLNPYFQSGEKSATPDVDAVTRVNPQPEKPLTAARKHSKTSMKINEPQTPLPTTDKPTTVKPTPAKASVILNTEKLNTEKLNTDKPNTQNEDKDLSAEAAAEARSVVERERDLREAIADFPGKRKLKAITDGEWEKMLEVFRGWRRLRGKNAQTKMTPARGRAILERLRFGYTLEDILQGVEGVALSAHHMGNNERGEVYDDIELICRTDQKLQEHIDRLERKKSDNGTTRQNTPRNSQESSRRQKLRESATRFGWGGDNEAHDDVD